MTESKTRGWVFVIWSHWLINLHLKTSIKQSTLLGWIYGKSSPVIHGPSSHQPDSEPSFKVAQPGLQMKQACGACLFLHLVASVILMIHLQDLGHQPSGIDLAFPRIGIIPQVTIESNRGEFNRIASNLILGVGGNLPSTALVKPGNPACTSSWWVSN